MPRLLEVLGWWIETLPPPGSKGLTEKRLPLANHARVEDQSITRWSREHRDPMGETIFRVAFFLESFFGVEIEEISNSNELEINKLARTFGSGVVEIEKLSELLGFANRTDSVLRLMRGKAGTTEERLEKIRSINSDYASRVEMVRKNISFLKPHSTRQSEVKEVSQEPKITIPKALTTAEEALLLHVEISIMPVMELMERLVASDNPAVRDEFRLRTAKVWRRFSKLSSALTSEQARSARIADGLILYKGDNK